MSFSESAKQNSGQPACRHGGLETCLCTCMTQIAISTFRLSMGNYLHSEFMALCVCFVNKILKEKKSGDIPSEILSLNVLSPRFSKSDPFIQWLYDKDLQKYLKLPGELIKTYMTFH